MTRGLARVCVGVGAGLVLSMAGGCAAGRTRPSKGTPASSAAAAPVPLETCSLLGGEIEVRVPRPQGYAIARSAQACMVAEERAEGPIFFTVSAVIGGQQIEAAGGSDPKAALLAEPDGVVVWARRSDLFAEPPRRVGDETLELGGEAVHAYRLVGRPAGMDEVREAMVLRLRHGDLYVVVLAFYDPQQEAQRRQARSLLQAIRWEDRNELERHHHGL